MNRSVRKARLSRRHSGETATMHRMGVEGVVHHFIAEASQNIHRLHFSPPTASLIGKRTTVDEERKREQERERERERKVEGVVIYDTAARGSFHTFLQSLSSLSSWKELIFMSVLERTFCTHIAA